MEVRTRARTRVHRLFSAVLSIVLVATTTPFVPGAAVAEEDVRYEIVEERTTHSRTYRLPDGSRETELFSAPVFYPDADTGELLEIDNTLEETQTAAGHAWTNRSNRFSATLPRELGGGLGLA